MSVILRHGDRIHLAAPANTNAEALAIHRDMSAGYSAMGVTVVMFTTNSQLTHPVVVAVIRNPPEVVMEPHASPF